MLAHSTFELAGRRDWRAGFTNLLDNELARWWRTRLWLIQCLIWGGIMILVLGPWNRGGRPMRMDDAMQQFTTMTAIFQAVGVIILMQSVLVGEKLDGTAAWVLSKPAARPAFILSKLIANSLGILLTMVVLCSAITFAFCVTSIPGFAARAAHEPARYLAVPAIAFLHHLFYASLALMLGACFKSRMAVIAVPAAILLAQFDLIRGLPALRSVLPVNLVMDIANREGAVASLLWGYSMDFYIPIMACVAAECFIFVLIAVWRFSREEF